MAVRRVAIVTGSRAEFGLLRPIIRTAIERRGLEPRIIVAGSHLLEPACTVKEVVAEFGGIIASRVPMQADSERTSRGGDARAVGRGIIGFVGAFEAVDPDWVVVLGDRIEAFSAASAASIGGLAVAHLHGGDRAEGVADEAMRHAISKLAHLHLPATPRSAERLLRMGEPEWRVRVVGSPAIDGLASTPPITDERMEGLNFPTAVFLMHPLGRDTHAEHVAAASALTAMSDSRLRVLALAPNHDPGREGIAQAIAEAKPAYRAEHLSRAEFVGLLRRVKVIVGNSSAALIECAALGVPAVNIGVRQGGREHGANVVHSRSENRGDVGLAIAAALALPRDPAPHPFGDGHAGERTCEALVDQSLNPRDPVILRKRNDY